MRQESTEPHRVVDGGLKSFESTCQNGFPAIRQLNVCLNTRNAWALAVTRMSNRLSALPN
jgi:hypothetical protein